MSRCRRSTAPRPTKGCKPLSRAWRAGLVLVFALLATANSGGYRYGVGDQAFYIPATELRLTPESFPRDRALIESQARLTIVDEALAAGARITGVDLPTLFLALYALTLITLALGADRLARALGGTPWMSVAFVLLLSLRHRIAKTGANSLEGYMHPRMLAVGVGLFVVTAALRRRWTLAAAGWLVAAAIHPTTALWIGGWIAGGLCLMRVTALKDRELGLTAALSLVALACGTVLAAPLAHAPLGPLDRLSRMDPAWTAVFADKDYLFASTWPAYAWVLNLAYAPAIVLLWRHRRAAGATVEGESMLVSGALALLAAFAIAVPLGEARIALVVQLQVSRVFWMLDLLLAAYAAWWMTASPVAGRLAQAGRVAALALLIVSAARGAYTVAAAPDARALARRTLAPSAWADTMAWLRTQPSDWLVLAHPDHAWRYGTSVRVAAGRDVVVESVKDSAIAMYDRATAIRVAERLAALAAFDHLSTAEVHAIGRRYGAAVLVTDAAQRLALPALYTNAGFTVYDIR